MIDIKETQNFIRITCTQCDEYTAEEISLILDDLNITTDHIRSCIFTVWKDVSWDSDGTYRFHKDFRLDNYVKDWETSLDQALKESKHINKPEVTGKLLFKKPDPMKAIVDNVNLNLETLHGKLKKDL